jgi:hypothetical protein
MECVGLFVFVLVIVAVFAGISAQQRSELRQSYQRLSRQYGGSYECSGWFFSRPAVQFLHAGAPVTIGVTASDGSGAPYTQACFSWPQPRFRCELYPEDAQARRNKLRGMEDIQIGSPDFDAAYIVQGNRPDDLRQLLNSSVQLQIGQLRRFLGQDDIYVSFNGGMLLVKKRLLIERWNNLQKFVQLAIGLYDQAMLTLEGGIELVEHSHALPPNEIVCQVCGEPITSDKVICRRCKTPHHQDCWEYYGSCSTYGCPESSYLVATPKPKAARRSG